MLFQAHHALVSQHWPVYMLSGTKQLCFSLNEQPGNDVKGHMALEEPDQGSHPVS